MRQYSTIIPTPGLCGINTANKWGVSISPILAFSYHILRQGTLGCRKIYSQVDFIKIIACFGQRVHSPVWSLLIRTETHCVWDESLAPGLIIPSWAASVSQCGEKTQHDQMLSGRVAQEPWGRIDPCHLFIFFKERETDDIPKVHCSIGSLACLAHIPIETVMLCGLHYVL